VVLWMSAGRHGEVLRGSRGDTAGICRADEQPGRERGRERVERAGVGGVKAGDPPSWQAATSSASAYIEAVWKALVAALLISAAALALGVLLAEPLASRRCRVGRASVDPVVRRVG
jgi:hypothetical protein